MLKVFKCSFLIFGIVTWITIFQNCGPNFENASDDDFMRLDELDTFNSSAVSDIAFVEDEKRFLSIEMMSISPEGSHNCKIETHIKYSFAAGDSHKVLYFVNGKKTRTYTSTSSKTRDFKATYRCGYNFDLRPEEGQAYTLGIQLELNGKKSNRVEVNLQMPGLVVHCEGIEIGDEYRVGDQIKIVRNIANPNSEWPFVEFEGGGGQSCKKTMR